MKQEVILLSHGNLSKGMMHSAQMIVGEQENLSCYGLQPGMTTDTIIGEVQQRVAEKPDTLFILLADLLGGSLCNAATQLTSFKNVRLIAGMNLLLVVEILSNGSEALTDEELQDVIQQAREGTKEISLAAVSGDQKGDEDFF